MYLHHRKIYTAIQINTIDPFSSVPLPCVYNTISAQDKYITVLGSNNQDLPISNSIWQVSSKPDQFTRTVWHYEGTKTILVWLLLVFDCCSRLERLIMASGSRFWIRLQANGIQLRKFNRNHHTTQVDHRWNHRGNKQLKRNTWIPKYHHGKIPQGGLMLFGLHEELWSLQIMSSIQALTGLNNP